MKTDKREIEIETNSEEWDVEKPGTVPESAGTALPEDDGVAPGTDVVGATVAGIWGLFMFAGVAVGALLAVCEAIGGASW